MNSTELRQDVVIVGGGFAGTEVARRLSRHPNRFHVTLVNEQNYTTFSPMLPEVVSTSVLPGQIIAPLREMLPRGQRFVMGRVVAADLQRRRVRIAPNGRDAPREIPYDHLVIAVGARARLDLVPGLADHAIPLKLIGDAMDVRNGVIARLERAKHEEDPEERRRLVSFVVVGGGFSGVEVAGEIHDFIRAALRSYPRLDADEPRVTVVHAGPRLLPELPETLAARALASMTRRGIIVHLNATAKGADARGLDFEDGEGEARRVPAGLIVSTIGTRPNRLVERLGVETERGRIVVRPDLSVEGAPGCWAVGDCAAVPNAASSTHAPPTAQFAVREARTLANNLSASRAGRATRAFSFPGLGTIATMGNKRGIAEVMGVPVSGFPAWLLWRGFYLLQMPTLGRKVRLWVTWTWDMFFQRDVAQLDFASSRGIDRDHNGAHEPSSTGPPEGSPPGGRRGSWRRQSLAWCDSGRCDQARVSPATSPTRAAAASAEAGRTVRQSQSGATGTLRDASSSKRPRTAWDPRTVAKRLSRRDGDTVSAEAWPA